MPNGAVLAIIEQQTIVKDSVHKRLHAAQCEEFELLFKLFREHPESFWQFNKKKAYEWDQKTFLQALDDYELVPQADPNTSGQTARIMKYMGLLQLASQFPQIYNVLEINKSVLQNVLRMGDGEQYFNPPAAMARPTPEMQSQQAEAQEKLASAKAKLSMAQTKDAEVKAKTMQIMVSESRESRTAGLDAGGGGKMEQPKTDHDMSIEAMNAEATLMDAHTRAKDVEAKKANILLQDANDQENRQSQQKLEAVKLAKDIMDKKADMQIQQSEHNDAMRMDHFKHTSQLGAQQEQHYTDLAHQQDTHAADLEHQTEAQKADLKNRATVAKQAKKNAAVKPKP